MVVFACVSGPVHVRVHQLIWYSHRHPGLAVSLMISHAARLTPLDSRLSPVKRHILSPGNERREDGTKGRRRRAGGGDGEGNRGKEWKKYGREGEACMVK